MHAEAAIWQKRLRNEFFPGSDLVVRWNEEMCRYQVGQKVRNGASDEIDWFYVVTDGNDGFKPLDMRTVRKLYLLDKSRQKVVTADALRRDMRDRKEAEEERAGAERRYRIRHESKFVGGRWGFDA